MSNRGLTLAGIVVAALAGWLYRPSGRSRAREKRKRAFSAALDEYNKTMSRLLGYLGQGTFTSLADEWRVLLPKCREIDAKLAEYGIGPMSGLVREGIIRDDHSRMFDTLTDLFDDPGTTSERVRDLLPTCEEIDAGIRKILSSAEHSRFPSLAGRARCYLDPDYSGEPLAK